MWQLWLWQAILHGIKVPGEMNATNLGKVGYGWMTWEMLEARVAGCKISDV